MIGAALNSRYVLNTPGPPNVVGVILGYSTSFLAKMSRDSGGLRLMCQNGCFNKDIVSR